MPTGAFFNLRSFSEGGGEGWGNVRLSFTSKDETVNETATYETANQNTEQSQFVRYQTAKRINSSLFDRTNGAAPGFAQRLNGSTNERYGIAKSISVMPGDVINAEVFVKYVDPVTSNWNSALTTLMGQIAASTAGVVVDGSSYTISTSSFPYAGLLTTTTTGAPRAYLNWLVFDRNFGFITGGFRQMGSGAKETGTDVAHELLTLPAAITITQPGYVYIYLSNESPTLVDVFFDDFKVTHTKSPVIQAEEYYPFGGEFNSYSRENSTPNQYKYNAGSELQDELGLQVYMTDYRMYDPWGRLGWWSIDPKADQGGQESLSPYHYSFNNPIRYNDPKGDCPPGVDCAGLITLASADATVRPNGIGAHSLGIAQGLQNTVTGLIDAVSNPGQTLKGLGNLLLLGASQGNPATSLAIDNALGTNSFETGVALSNAVEKGVDHLVNGNGLQRGEVIGEIAGAVIGTKGTSAAIKGVSTLIKANRAVNVFRVFGGDAEAGGFSYTPKSPNSFTNFRDAAGLPSGGASGANNTGRFVLEGTVKNKNIIQKRSALPLDGNKGGAPEYIVNPKNIKVKRVSGANPEF